jgi:hexulose-6-phosphate isomerase
VDLGFQGVEIPTPENDTQAMEFAAAAKQSGLEIHSIMNQKHWKFPLSSADPEVVATGLEGMEMSLRYATTVGAGVVLLVPAVVNETTSYKDAYIRSQKNIKKLLPLAKELKVIIAIENVWNKFLLSPLEFARYIEELDHPNLKAYFDVGNIVLYGYPQDWIRTLDKLIVRIHIKGFDAKEKKFVNLRDGTIDWPEVRRALSDINYSGFINAELRDGDLDYLKDVSERMGQIIAGV